MTGIEKKKRNVTLSGLVNFIDGLWSACGVERIITFTTSHIDKLDLPLIRRGRMDKHIEKSYYCFEAFNVLTKNYLDVESQVVRSLLAETNITLADVAEDLMPKSDEDDAESCLKKLIEALKVTKDEAGKKAKEEAPVKAEKEEMEKQKNAQEKLKDEKTSAKIEDFTWVLLRFILVRLSY